MLIEQKYQPSADEAEQKKKWQRPYGTVNTSEGHWCVQRIKQRLTDVANGGLQNQIPVGQIHPHHSERDEEPNRVKNAKCE